MTKEQKKQLEEVRKLTHAFKHWHTVRPENQPTDYKESVGPYFELLLSLLDEAHEALNFYAQSEVSWNLYKKELTSIHVNYEGSSKARKALGEE